MAKLPKLITIMCVFYAHKYEGILFSKELFNRKIDLPIFLVS